MPNANATPIKTFSASNSEPKSQNIVIAKANAETLINKSNAKNKPVIICLYHGRPSVIFIMLIPSLVEHVLIYLHFLFS